MTQSSSRKVDSLEASQEIPLLYENGEFITVFTKLRKLICPSNQGLCSRKSLTCIRSLVAQKQLYKYVKHNS